jgi:hypothetical protein
MRIALVMQKSHNGIVKVRLRFGMYHPAHNDYGCSGLLTPVNTPAMKSSNSSSE